MRMILTKDGWKEVSEETKDVVGWSLVGIAALLGGYACYLFHFHISRAVGKWVVDSIFGG